MTIEKENNIDQKKVANYYDDFTRQLLHDYLRGNKRVSRQEAFFHDALTTASQNVLVVGCGIGDTSARLSRVPQVQSVLGVDISPKAIEIAQTLFADSGAEFAVADITDTPPEGKWDLILLPDVYEHIPATKRSAVHNNLRSILSEIGRVALTIPSPAHQRALLARGEGLQVVDEIVELTDLQNLATDIGGWLSFYCHVSAFRTYDYVHAVINVGENSEQSLTDIHRTVLNRSTEHRVSILAKIRRRLTRRYETQLRRRRLKQRLGADATQSAGQILK